MQTIEQVTFDADNRPVNHSIEFSDIGRGIPIVCLEVPEGLMPDDEDLWPEGGNPGVLEGYKRDRFVDLCVQLGDLAFAGVDLVQLAEANSPGKFDAGKARVVALRSKDTRRSLPGQYADLPLHNDSSYLQVGPGLSMAFT